METTSYYSDSGSGFFQESGTILTLAEATWRAFKPFLSKYQWAFDAPSHSPRKTEIASAIRNKGKDGCCTFRRPEGYTFKLRRLRDWAFEQAINDKRKIYYVSYGKQALLYFDIDLHQHWQTAEQGEAAKRIIESVLRKCFGASVLFWNYSSRGINGYLKVNLQGMEFTDANKVFERLENALRLVLAFTENLADFEIKGKVGFLVDDETCHWAQYGKLPIHSPNWNFARLEEFKSRPVVSIRRLEALCRDIERQVPQEVLLRWKEFKASKGDEPRWDGDWFLVSPKLEKALLTKYGEGWRFMFMCQGNDDETWMDREYYQPGKIPELMTVEEWLTRKRERSAAQRPVKITPQTQPEPPPQESQSSRQVEAVPEPPPQEQSVKSPLKINIKLVDLASEPDSFVRQKEALFRFSRYLKRVPTVEEALAYLHDEKLFTAPWEENLDRRKTRVRDILKWIANTFDASKCAKGSVNVGKYDEWARKKFPNGLIYSKRKKHLDVEGEVIEFHQNVHVSTQFIACFMALAEFALLIDKNQDNSFPHDRAEELWKSLYAKGLFPVQFCPKQWPVCRDMLEQYGIVRITDRDYRTGKAMKWDVDRFFPGLGLWKGKKHRGPGCSPTRRKKRTTRTHNTWLCQQPVDSGLLPVLARSRPPP